MFTIVRIIMEVVTRMPFAQTVSDPNNANARQDIQEMVGIQERVAPVS